MTQDMMFGSKSVLVERGLGNVIEDLTRWTKKGTGKNRLNGVSSVLLGKSSISLVH